METTKNNLDTLIEAINNSDIEPAQKTEIITKLKTGDKEQWSQAVRMVMEFIKVACTVWNSFPH